MVTTTTQNNDFIRNVIDGRLLEAAIEWISDNMEPEDVFGNARLEEWAKEWAERNGYAKED